MSPQSSVTSCAHIKVTGVRCGSPALRGEQFCYFHQRMIRGVKTPPRSRLHPMALLENEDAIQASIMEVMNALARNTVDIRRADLLLRALNAAIRNARRVRFEALPENIVRQIPDYRDPPPVERVGTVAADVTARSDVASEADPAKRKPATSVTESDAPLERMKERMIERKAATPA